MYIMDIKVRYSEVNQHCKVTVHQIMEYFQDCGTFQSEDLGFGIIHELEQHRGWFLLAWDIVVERYPMFGEELRVITDPYKMQGFYGYRRYSIIDKEGHTIVKGDSIWIFMDLKKMLPIRISEEMRTAYIQSDTDSTVTVKRKISEDEEWTYIDSIEVTKVYLDSNSHVNNTFYALWAEELMPKDTAIKEIKIDYRQSALLGDTIRIEQCCKKDIIKFRYIKEKQTLVAIVEVISSGKDNEYV